MMKIIVESGATKADFCLCGEWGQVRFRTGGINLATMDRQTVSCRVRDAVFYLGMAAKEYGEHISGNISEIWFYGAGIVSDSAPAVLADVFAELFCDVPLMCGSDMLAAARALFGDRPGVAAILGTGSNSCLYDGKGIVRNVRPCGYVLGDYGSGSALGKAFLADYLQELMPVSLAEDFRTRSGLDYESVVSSVYKGEAPARFLASFAPYIVSVARGDQVLSCGYGPGSADAWTPDDASRDYAERILKENFRAFIDRCLRQYDLESYEVGVAGSFGEAACDFFSAVAEEYGIKDIVYAGSPMDGLCRYHAANPGGNF